MLTGLEGGSTIGGSGGGPSNWGSESRSKSIPREKEGAKSSMEEWLVKGAWGSEIGEIL